MTAAPSLRRQALRAFLWPMAAVAVMVLVLGAVTSFATISSLRDRELVRMGGLLEAVMLHDAQEGDALERLNYPEDELLNARLEYRVWSDLGLVAESANMPEIADTGTEGFRRVSWKGETWVYYTHKTSTDAIEVRVAEPFSVRLRMTGLVVLSLVVPLAAMMLAVVVIGNRLLAKAFAPLENVSRLVRSRDPDDLSPLDAPGLAVEAEPLIRAVNSLFGQLRRSIDAEREFNDNAAHELRTPLAAVRAKAQLLDRRARDNPDLHRDVTELIAAVDRATVVIDQLLQLAHGFLPEEGHESCDAADIVSGVARDRAPAAIAKGLDFEAEIEPELVFHGSADALGIVVGNLLDNAIKFTPSEGSVRISATGVDGADGGLRISVADTGRGIAPGDEMRIFRRFMRQDTTQPGSGLGLSIVDRIVRQHRGHIAVSRREPRGLEVTVTLP